MADYTVGNPSELLGSTEFVVSIFEDLKNTAYEAKYPELKWTDCVPAESIDTAINVGATSASYTAKDMTGVGAFRAVSGSDAPQVGVSMDKITVRLESAHVSAVVDLDEARTVSMGYSGLNLITDKGEAMRRAAERHIERTVFFGQSDLGFEGYLNYSLTSATPASTKAASGTTWINNATPDEILFDINNAISTVWSTSREVFLPNVIELPTAQFAYIAGTRINGTGGDGVNETILSFVKRNNIYTAMTGQELEIKSLRYLDQAGAANADRMIASEKKKENHWLPMPETFNMLAPQQRGADTDLYAIYKFGSYHKPYPSSCIYVDGI